MATFNGFTSYADYPIPPRPELWDRLREHGLEPDAVSEVIPNQFTIHFTSMVPQWDVDRYRRTLERLGYEYVPYGVPYMYSNWPDPDGSHHVILSVRKVKSEMKLYWTHEESQDLNAGETELNDLLKVFMPIKIPGVDHTVIWLQKENIPTLRGMMAVWRGAKVGANPYDAIMDAIERYGKITIRVKI